MHEHDENCEHSECRKPEIDYPTAWEFKLIGPDGEAMRTAVAEVMADRAYELVPANESSGGKYVSMKLTTTVESEQQRYEIHDQLGKSPAVKVAF
jgi:putative lipoic acid-binding regulatory protein